MGCTACAEPQCLYKGALYSFPCVVYMCVCQTRIIHVVRNIEAAVRNPYGERRGGMSLVGCVSNTKQFAVLQSDENFVSSGGYIRCRILPTSNVTFCTCSVLRIWKCI